MGNPGLKSFFAGNIILDQDGLKKLHDALCAQMGFDRDKAKAYNVRELLESLILQWHPDLEIVESARQLARRSSSSTKDKFTNEVKQIFHKNFLLIFSDDANLSEIELNHYILTRTIIELHKYITRRRTDAKPKLPNEVESEEEISARLEIGGIISEILGIDHDTTKPIDRVIQDLCKKKELQLLEEVLEAADILIDKSKRGADSKTIFLSSPYNLAFTGYFAFIISLHRPSYIYRDNSSALNYFREKLGVEIFKGDSFSSIIGAYSRSHNIGFEDFICAYRDNNNISPIDRFSNLLTEAFRLAFSLRPSPALNIGILRKTLVEGVADTLNFLAHNKKRPEYDYLKDKDPVTHRYGEVNLTFDEIELGDQKDKPSCLVTLHVIGKPKISYICVLDSPEARDELLEALPQKLSFYRDRMPLFDISAARLIVGDVMCHHEGLDQELSALSSGVPFFSPGQESLIHSRPRLFANRLR